DAEAMALDYDRLYREVIHRRRAVPAPFVPPAVWFRLDLRPPKEVVPVAPARNPAPVPGPEVRLTPGELDEAFKNSNLYSWSAMRLALAVLDAHGGPLEPSAAVATLTSRTKWHVLRERSESFGRRPSAVAVCADGRWDIAADAGEAVLKMRTAVRARVADARVRGVLRPDPEEQKRLFEERAQQRAAHGAKLARLSRALLVGFPAKQPRAVALLDVAAHELSTYVGGELASLAARLEQYEIIGAVEVRSLLRALGIDPGQRRLAELGPAQKTITIDDAGRTLKLTTGMLVEGSCGISKPFGEERRLAEYLEAGELTKLRRRLEADVKSLYALYEYGRLHGVVRLRWGYLDERILAPWVHRDEPTLYRLMQTARELEVPLEVVVGSAPGWEEPWARARLAFVQGDETAWRTWLVDEDGEPIEEADVQRARLKGGVH
ncbi:MAG: hypothetical protein ACK4N5_04420, partial [Myxococcales bacterium]